jgi:hypothetical protein
MGTALERVSNHVLNFKDEEQFNMPSQLVHLLSSLSPSQLKLTCNSYLRSRGRTPDPYSAWDAGALQSQSTVDALDGSLTGLAELLRKPQTRTSSITFGLEHA